MQFSKVFRKTGLCAALIAVMLLTLAVSVRPAHAEGVFINLVFEPSQLVVGKTGRLGIYISNQQPNAIRSTKFVCIADGTSVSGASISQLPAVIAANSQFSTEQYYRAVSGGTTQIHCELTAVDTVTGAQISVSSPVAYAQVSPEQRLYFEAYSATHVATVGQLVYVNALFGNRGSTTFTNVVVSCPELGRALVNISSQEAPTTLGPGQSGFVQSVWKAVRTGSAPIACGITATDSSTGATVSLLAPLIQIEVR